MEIRVIRPTDQPTGSARLLGIIRAALNEPGFTTSLWVVAFARVSPLLKLKDAITSFKARGGTIEALFGIDHLGTSLEALELAGQLLTRVGIVHAPGRFGATFHPKVYVFLGLQRALFIIGSHNATPGGFETNFESSISIDLDRTADANLFDELFTLWRDPCTLSVDLDEAILKRLQNSGLLCKEADRRRERRKSALSRMETNSLDIDFPEVSVDAPEALPRPKHTHRGGVKRGKPSRQAAMGATGLVMQIVPHHNGEIFLSYRAVKQDPDFFGYPFTGATIPKRKSNKPYPQLDPDPIVNLRVYDENGDHVHALLGFPLNVVDYERKREIRITIPPSVAARIPSHAILVMQESDSGSLDYRMDVYKPGSPLYEELLGVCNQEMPSGGAARPRRFGWF